MIKREAMDKLAVLRISTDFQNRLLRPFRVHKRDEDRTKKSDQDTLTDFEFQSKELPVFRG